VSEPALSRIPGLRGEQVTSDTAAQAATRLARTVASHLRRRLAALTEVHLALSGGSSARLLSAALAAEPLLSDAEWAAVQVWLVDERCVADEDPRSNARLLRELLWPGLPLPAGHLHPMPVLQADGAPCYERELVAALGARIQAEERRLDAVILGMGPDGHTAGLFPETPALDEGERLVVVNDGERVAPPRPRMTMTYPIINSAAFIGLLVTGAEKRPALAAVAANPQDFHNRPVAGVVPGAASSMVWFLDRAALPFLPS